MHRFAFGISALLGALLLNVGAIAGDASIQRDCTAMVKLLPGALQDLPMTFCEARDDSQVKLEASLRVPATRVLETAKTLQQSTGMKPLRFVCCGYETQSVTLVIPANHSLKQGTPAGAFRDISVSFSAPGFADASTEQRIYKLGELDGTLSLELVDY